MKEEKDFREINTRVLLIVAATEHSACVMSAWLHVSSWFKPRNMKGY